MLLPLNEWARSNDFKYLCVIKTVNGKKQYGFLLNGIPEVNLGYIFDGGNGQYITYDSLEAIEQDGWIVD